MLRRAPSSRERSSQTPPLRLPSLPLLGKGISPLAAEQQMPRSSTRAPHADLLSSSLGAGPHGRQVRLKAIEQSGRHDAAGQVAAAQLRISMLLFCEPFGPLAVDDVLCG